MPSIPQSLLWISLVVLWLFVLVPMLISKRDAVRRTSDVALATRVLNSGAAARLIKRGGPAAGHRSDPDWRPEEDEYDDLDDLDSDDAEDAPTSRVVATGAVSAGESVEDTGPDYLDLDVMEPDSEASSSAPAGSSAADDETTDDTDAEVTPAVEDDSADEDNSDDEYDSDDEYEYVDDTSGIAVGEEPLTNVTPAFSRRHRYDTDATAASVEARKYAFRRRVLMIMATTLVGSAGSSFLLSSGWWFCGMTSTVTVLYLGYLRRQTRIETRVRRRRMQRAARSRMGVESTYDREYDVVPSRLRRPGAAVLEIDDEDPIFEHLDYAPYAREYVWQRDLQRAAGQ
jgi:hypothetical protein